MEEKRKIIFKDGDVFIKPENIKAYTIKKYSTKKEDSFLTRISSKDLDDIPKILQEYGVAIIPSLFNEEECENMKVNMWTYLSHITQTWENPITEDNPSSWRGFSDLSPLHSMLVQHHQIGHSQLCWDVRQNPKVSEVFCKIHNTLSSGKLKNSKCKVGELISSFDGASIHFPPEKTRKGWCTGRASWLHVDQSYTRNDFENIQSWVTAFDVNEGDATLVVLEKSHLYHAIIAKQFNIVDKKDWYVSTPEMIEAYKALGCEYQRIICPKGSMVLWNSMTIHSGQEALKTRKVENFRCVVYICMAPRKLVNKKQQEKHQEVFENMRMTTHNPHKIRQFPVNPRTYGNTPPDITPIEKPILTDLGKSLI